ncbi:MAG TPA: DUF86 domain-containing protein [Alicycliphilus sp.]|nr:DUF86 domain-containing protein [Alicycliphilus sp.]
MNKAQRVPDYLAHILQALERIGRYTRGVDQATFEADELVQDAVLRNIETMVEAANNILRAAPAFAAQHAHIPRLVMYTMRNRVSHGYDQVDLEIVWKTLQADLPALYAPIRALLPPR